MLSIVKTTIAPSSKSSAVRGCRAGSRLDAPTTVALTKEHEARQRQTLLGEKLAKVGVGRHQDPLFVKCCGQHLIIDMARKIAVEDMDDVMPGFGKEWCKPNAEALVEQEPHADVRSGTCRSPTAIAANSGAARTSSSDSCG